MTLYMREPPPSRTDFGTDVILFENVTIFVDWKGVIVFVQ